MARRVKRAALKAVQPRTKVWYALLVFAGLGFGAGLTRAGVLAPTLAAAKDVVLKPLRSLAPRPARGLMRITEAKPRGATDAADEGGEMVSPGASVSGKPVAEPVEAAAPPHEPRSHRITPPAHPGSSGGATSAHDGAPASLTSHALEGRSAAGASAAAPPAQPHARASAGKKVARVATRSTRARAALIIDDCGNSWKNAEGFVHAPVPLTLAVLPHLPFSTYIANESHAAGKGVMLHFPMEALGSINPGPGTLRVAMPAAEQAVTIRRNLDAVPHLDGVNNHEGSRVTSDEELMVRVLEAVKRRDLFFVDSLTSPASSVGAAAAKVGLRCSHRDVFLDNDDDIELIKRQLRLLIDDSLERGEAIGIGHVRPQTLTAIIEMAPAFEEAGVRLVLARELKPLKPAASSVGPSAGRAAPGPLALAGSAHVQARRVGP